MSRLPVISARKFIKVLKNAGFVHDHTEGSHQVFYHSVKKIRVSVPVHQGRDLGQGIMLSLLKDAKLTREEFLRLL